MLIETFKQSVEQTLPLNSLLNESFQKYPLEEVEMGDIWLVANVMLPQAKLFIDEFEETIFETDMAKTLDGIGDIITTVDGYFYLLGISAENIANDYIDVYEEGFLNPTWCISGLDEFNSEVSSQNELKSVEEIMFSDFNELYVHYSVMKTQLDLANKYASKVDVSCTRRFSMGIMEANFIDVPIVDAETFSQLSSYAANLRYKVDAYCRSLGYDPVKVLKAVYTSNMSKFCESLEDADLTIELYKSKGLDCLEIVKCAGLERWFVRTTKEAMFNGQLIPKGKFMKGIHFKEPDWSDLTKYELEA